MPSREQSVSHSDRDSRRAYARAATKAAPEARAVAEVQTATDAYVERTRQPPCTVNRREDTWWRVRSAAATDSPDWEREAAEAQRRQKEEDRRHEEEHAA